MALSKETGERTRFKPKSDGPLWVLEGILRHDMGRLSRLFHSATTKLLCVMVLDLTHRKRWESIVGLAV